MAISLSVFSTQTRWQERGDNYPDAMDCYGDLADEVIVMDGDKTWPKEFKWDIIGKHFQKGYEFCSGDWVIHADLDFLFHQDDFKAIRQACENNPNAPALSFWKYQFILPDRYNLKSRLVICVNKKKYGDRIKFNSGGDLCQPSLDGHEITPDLAQEARVPLYNYEKLLKTPDQIMDDCGRMARAWQRQFGNYKLGGPDDESAFHEWAKMMAGRFSKPQKEIELSKHPKYIQNTIRGLRKGQFGYDGFGLLSVKKNNYVGVV